MIPKVLRDAINIKRKKKRERKDSLVSHRHTALNTEKERENEEVKKWEVVNNDI